MLDHLAISVPADKFQETLDFYLAALAPLGYELQRSFMDGKVVGLGAKNGGPDFWLAGMSDKGTSGAHWAFSTDDKQVVHDFHEKAIAAGGKDNGAAGPRPQYGPSYYGAFIIDPVGNNVEVICRK